MGDAGGTLHEGETFLDAADGPSDPRGAAERSIRAKWARFKERSLLLSESPAREGSLRATGKMGNTSFM